MRSDRNSRRMASASAPGARKPRVNPCIKYSHRLHRKTEVACRPSCRPRARATSGESACHPRGAEGATAPETLRQTDRCRG